MSDSPTSLIDKPICQFFKKRQCYKGRACPFLHIIDSNSSTENSQDEVSVRNQVAPRFQKASRIYQNSSSHRQHGNHATQLKSRRICEHYQRGLCAFDAHCKFLHLDPEKKNYLNSEIPSDGVRNIIEDIQKVHVAEENDDQILVTSPSKEPSTPEGRKLCRYYQQGHCRNGKRCRFLHFRRIDDQTGKKLPEKPQEDVRGGTRTKRRSDVKNLDEKKEETNSSLTELNHTINQSDNKLLKTKRSQSQVPLAVSDNARASQENVRAVQQFSSATEARDKEIEQLNKRFPMAIVNAGDGETMVKFPFSPSDPDWPYDVKEVKFEVTLPKGYPCEMMQVSLSEDEVVPELVSRLIGERIMDWVEQRFHQMKNSQLTKSGTSYDLAVRPMLRWFDKNAEDIFTSSLKQYKRVKMAEAAGLQFIPAAELRKIYTQPIPADTCNEVCNTTPKKPKDAELEQESSKKLMERSTEQDSGSATKQVENDAEGKELAGSVGSTESGLKMVGEAKRRGTEVMLRGLELSEGVASLRLSHTTMTIACGRCSRTCEISTPAERVNSASCAFCHSSMLIRFNPSLVHERSGGVAGYLDLENCSSADMNLSRSKFVVSCLKCDHDAKIESLAPGQQNVSWCQHCHQKLNISVASVRFVQLTAPSTNLGGSGSVVTVEVQKRIKPVKDPLIQEGKPLPDHGTCKHYKKSYRWFRFPCCGKAYPCDICHDENENHEMKLANRMICGHCAKEQTFSSEGTCNACKGSMTYRATTHWEGGLGCRDKIKMSKKDNKKYKDTIKTAAKSVEKRKEEKAKSS